MKQVIIENPILNSPFEEPAQHFRFVENNITEHTDPGRRVSSYFVPIAQPRARFPQAFLVAIETGEAWRIAAPADVRLELAAIVKAAP